jgi:hypothetical protein
MRLPREIMALFMGASPFHTGIFLLALGMMVLALISGVRGRVGLTTAAALVLVFLMVIMRDLVRTAYLAPYFTLDDLTVTGQYSSLIAFLIALTAGAAAVALAARWGLSATSAPNR